jgi:hypothetical protein
MLGPFFDVASFIPSTRWQLHVLWGIEGPFSQEPFAQGFGVEDENIDRQRYLTLPFSFKKEDLLKIKK